MYYLYDNDHLIPVRDGAEEAVALARFTNSVLVTNKIDEAARIAYYPLSAFLLTPKNGLTLFGFWKYQLRCRTIKAFRIILYAQRKNLLYHVLACAAWLSLGTYRLIPYDRKER